MEYKSIDGRLAVSILNYNTDEKFIKHYDTVLYAIGRTAVTRDLKLHLAKVAVDHKTNKIIVNEYEQTSTSNIFAIGDCVMNRLELTPVAIKSAIHLVSRLFTTLSLDVPFDYSMVATTVFAPIEYGIFKGK